MLRALGTPGRAAPAVLGDLAEILGHLLKDPLPWSPNQALGSWKGMNVLVPRREIPPPPGCQGQLRGHNREGKARQSFPPPIQHPKNPKPQELRPGKSHNEVPEFRDSEYGTSRIRRKGLEFPKPRMRNGDG